eukprot:TRINITY_DN32000_c0_g1_i1.p1 TRINITY_DN32000_c0_g1~~TRINITY_DN32000_c0_g1_i1.p1  ORF type:complete len:652 (+),score=96.18 TRINITY_DN32000_c0_g1_i1:98-2053(+)
MPPKLNNRQPNLDEKREKKAEQDATVPSYTKTDLPPCADHELEFVVPNCTSYERGERVRSEPLTVRNFRFRALVFPHGTAKGDGSFVSVFVEADPLEGLDSRWVFARVKYQVAIVNWLDYRRSVVKSDVWTFTREFYDRGWHDMQRVGDLSQESGWLGPDNSLLIRVMCCVRQAEHVRPESSHSCRTQTGHVGLMNHGATAYMNGPLQSLYHCGEFRRIVYSMQDSKGKSSTSNSEDHQNKRSFCEDGDSDSDGNHSLITALQDVFYKLQTSDQAVNCRELVKSLALEDAFSEHDAVEFHRSLCDRLEEQMKGTSMDGSIKRLFQGEMENYIECSDIAYTSKRPEKFYDIQLNIISERGEPSTIEESLREFTVEQTLEGCNSYEVEGHGKQRAKKGIRFLSLPPVLNLQLKRFYFDTEKKEMVKLNSHFEFQRRIDLSPFAPGAGTYLLHSVIVHCGGADSGHYHAHIRPNLDERWLKFDDEWVTPCSDYSAVVDNFGGADQMVMNYFECDPGDIVIPFRPRVHSAYMLVYVQEESAAEILRVPDPMQVNQRIAKRSNRQESRKKARSQQQQIKELEEQLAQEQEEKRRLKLRVKELEETNQCAVCMSRSISHRLDPCGHCFCEADCTAAINTGKCPNCRKKPTFIQKIYF